MSDKIQSLQEKRLKLHADIKAHADTQDTWNAEDQEKWTRLNAEYDGVIADLKTENDALAAKAAVAERIKALGDEQGLPGGGRFVDFSNTGKDKAALVNGPSEEDRVLALQAWCAKSYGLDDVITDEHIAATRRCNVNLNAKDIAITNRLGSWGIDVRNAQSVGTSTAGGYTVPQGFMANLERALLAHGGVLRICDIMRTADGRAMPWPTVNDTSNAGALIAENAQVSETALTFSSVTFNAYKFTSGLILVSHELMRDSAFDLAREIGSLAGERIGRAVSSYTTTGTGSSQPQGAVTGSTAGKTAASATAITFDELYDLKYSVDPAYRVGPQVAWMLHNNVLLAVKKLKDGNSRYLWSAGTTADTPDTIDGDPVIINQQMASSIAISAKTVLYGDFSRFKVRQVQGVRLRRLSERYADYDQEGFVAFMEFDSKLLNAGTNPLKHLIQAAV